MTGPAWCYLLAALCLIKGVMLLFFTARTAEIMRRFPTNRLAGQVLTAVAWIWAAITLNHYPIDFLAMIHGFPTYLIAIVCIPLSCFLLPDLLACRGIAAICMLFPMPMFLACRMDESAWRLLPITIGYIALTYGMIVMFYPYYMRRLFFFLADRPRAMKGIGAAVLLLAILFCVAGSALTPEAAG